MSLAQPLLPETACSTTKPRSIPPDSARTKPKAPHPFAHRFFEIFLLSSAPPDKMSRASACGSSPAREEPKRVDCNSKRFHRPALRPVHPRLFNVDAPLLALQPAPRTQRNHRLAS